MLARASQSRGWLGLAVEQNNPLLGSLGSPSHAYRVLFNLLLHTDVQKGWRRIKGEY